jgi:uncharacterized protein (DUF849 family)
MSKTTPTLIIQVRVNEGMSKSGNPNTPYSPEEIARSAIESWQAGASVVHFHAGDPQTGAASTSVELYSDTVRRLKQTCDMIVVPTLGAAMLPTAEERLAHILELAKDPATKPDAIPVDMGTTNMDTYDRKRKDFLSDERVYFNTTKTLKYLCKASREVGVKPAAMIWDVAAVRVTQAFVEMGLYTEPLFCEIPLFGDGFEWFGHEATGRGMDSLLAFFPKGHDWQWFTDSHGGNEFPVVLSAIERGGHVCVGLGDYAYPELGYPTNAQLVEKVVELSHLVGREVATAAQARELLGFTRTTSGRK